MCGKELIMHNKAPLWNESSQVKMFFFINKNDFKIQITVFANLNFFPIFHIKKIIFIATQIS